MRARLAAVGPLSPCRQLQHRSLLPSHLPRGSTAAATTGHRTTSSSVLVRFNEKERPVSARDLEELDSATHTGSPTDTKLTPEEIEALRFREPGMKQYWPSSAEISPRTAEMRADLGNAGDFWQAQSFDGPAPETANGRLCMLAVPLGLFLEARTGMGLWQQTLDHPLVVAGVVALIAVATWVPISKGYTRKEAFQTWVWRARYENWLGRAAMLGFAGMALTELITGVNTLQAWHLQSVPFSG